MKKNIITLLVLTLSVGAFAQDKPGVGIGTKKPSAAAVLDVAADNKGVLIPRINLGDLTKFGLASDTKDEGMLIYNKTAVTNIPVGFYYWTNIDTPRWELITSESVLNQKIENVTNEFNTKIDNLTKIEGASSTDLSYLMAFTPVSDGSSLGDMSYLIPEKDTDGNITYKKVGITFADLVGQSETETFIREVKKKVKNDKDVEVEVVDYYVYFSESVVREWKKANDGVDINDATKGLKDSEGTKIDVIGAVTTNFGDIFNTTENKKIIEEIVVNTPGNVIVKKEGDKWVLNYIDENGDTQLVDINTLETKTKVGKRSYDGKDLSVVDYKNDATDAKKGEILYEYFGEEKDDKGNPIPYYINMTADIVTSIQNNEELKNEIFNTINNFITDGSNVYYGPINTGDTENVLYYIDSNGDKKVIDISENVLNVITNNPTVIEKIKEITEVKVVEKDGDIPTGETINGKKVYKGISTITVAGKDPKKYDSTSDAAISVKPMKQVYGADGKVTLEPTNEVFGRLLRVSVLDVNGSVVVDSATDATAGVDGKSFEFYFGVGNMYAPIFGGTYEVIYEYVVK
ncbi:hypothetical protein [Myroides phaeus]|uniref:Uncharacterized protein n=1 Tax=Myroides phaeus TaxID=702745 RepID=A0A1G8D859_9FLAO|nr:hypothetical protein [Myroides phaeus]SDH53529.1 hypothetical protein SAMN05421818_10629 [Myroides phaeus]